MVDDPGIISNVHQVTFTEPIAVIVVQNPYKNKCLNKKNILYKDLYRICIKNEHKMHHTPTHMKQEKYSLQIKSPEYLPIDNM